MDKSKWCFNYESGKYEDIDEDGYSWTSHKYVNNWDDSEFKREEQERKEQEEREERERREQEEREERERRERLTSLLNGDDDD